MAEKPVSFIIFDFNGTLEEGGELYPGVGDMLKELDKKHDYVFAIVSNGDSHEIRKMLAEEGLDKYFGDPRLDNTIFGYEEISKATNGEGNKTDPRVLEALLENVAPRYGDDKPSINYEQTVVVGDTSVEFLMAKRNGIGFVFVDVEHDPATNAEKRDAKRTQDEKLFPIPADIYSGYVDVNEDDIHQCRDIGVKQIRDIPVGIAKSIRARHQGPSSSQTKNQSPSHDHDKGPDF